MPKTVQEILKETGLTDEEIAKIDAKVTSGFTQILKTADDAQNAAELARRAQADQYDKEIAPALDNWANEKTNMAAQLNYYKTIAEQAKAGGFVPDKDFTPPANGTRGSDGKFVANANAVPGSPDVVKTVRDQIGGAIGVLADIQHKYRTLFGKEMPDAPTEFFKEAESQHLHPIAYAEKKYGFTAREKQIREEDQKKHDDAIRAEVSAAKDKEWAEKIGNNPNVRQAEASKFSVLDKAVKDGARPDPLKMTPQERHAASSRAIQAEIARNTVQ